MQDTIYFHKDFNQIECVTESIVLFLQTIGVFRAELLAEPDRVLDNFRRNLLQKVKAQFALNMGDNGAHFIIPIRVDLLQKPFK